MKFCTKCGAKLEQEQTFCTQCGYNVGSRENKVNEENVSNNQYIDKNQQENVSNNQSINKTQLENNDRTIVQSKPVRKKIVFSMKAKLSIIGISIVAISLVAFFIVGNSLSKPSKIVSKFEKAVASGNKAELMDVLYCDDNRLKIDEKNIAPLLTYFKDNPSYLNTVIQDLNKEALKEGETKRLSESSGNKSNSVVSIAYTGKKFLFFPNYKISIRPAFVKVNTSIKDVVFSLNNTEIGKSDTDSYSKEFGPFVPGKYKLLANYKGKYTTLSEPHDVNFIDNANSKEEVSVFTNVNYLKLKSEYPEAEIFVNGKATGVKIMDAQNFGPLNSGTKIYATITKDGKTLKSDEETVEQGDTNYDLSFRQAENQIKSVQDDIHTLIKWYTYYFAEAVNTNNFSAVEYYIYPGSKLYTEQQSYIPSTYAKGVKESVMSFNITSCNLNQDNTSGTVTTEEVYKIESNGKSEVKTFKYKYTFRYNEAKRSYQLESIADN